MSEQQPHVDNLNSPRPLRVGPILLGCILGFLLGEVLASVLEALGATLAHYPGGVRALAGVASPPWWATALGLVGLWCGFAGSIIYAGRSGGLDTTAGLWRLRPSDALWLGVGVLAQVVIDGTYSFFNVQHLSGPENTLFGGSHGASFALMGILTILGSPIIEEWLFRGVIFRSLSLGLGKSAPLLAALVSAVLFAAAHGEAKQFAGLFALGLLLAFVFYKTQRLTASIAVHAGFNALAYGSLLLQRSHA